MQFCVTRVILRDLAALVPQIFHSLHKITHFLTEILFSDHFSNEHIYSDKSPTREVVNLKCKLNYID
jgi:hypothetical protein